MILENSKRRYTHCCQNCGSEWEITTFHVGPFDPNEAEFDLKRYFYCNCQMRIDTSDPIEKYILISLPRHQAWV